MWYQFLTGTLNLDPGHFFKVYTHETRGHHLKLKKRKSTLNASVKVFSNKELSEWKSSLRKWCLPVQLICSRKRLISTGSQLVTFPNPSPVWHTRIWAPYMQVSIVWFFKPGVRLKASQWISHAHSVPIGKNQVQLFWISSPSQHFLFMCLHLVLYRTTPMIFDGPKRPGLNCLAPYILSDIVISLSYNFVSFIMPALSLCQLVCFLQFMFEWKSNK